LLHTFSSNASVFILTYFFDLIIVGYFSLAYRIVFLSFRFIVEPLYNTLYHRTINKINNNRKVKNDIIKTYKILISGSLPIFIIFFVLAPKLFSIFFGANWTESGFYAQYLSVTVFFSFITSPFSFIPLIAKKQKQALYFEIIHTIFQVSGLLIGGYLNNPNLSVILFSSFSGIVLTALMIWYYFTINDLDKRIQE